MPFGRIIDFFSLDHSMLYLYQYQCNQCPCTFWMRKETLLVCSRIGTLIGFSELLCEIFVLYLSVFIIINMNMYLLLSRVRSIIFIRFDYERAAHCLLASIIVIWIDTLDSRYVKICTWIIVNKWKEKCFVWADMWKFLYWILTSITNVVNNFFRFIWYVDFYVAIIISNFFYMRQIEFRYVCVWLIYSSLSYYA